VPECRPHPLVNLGHVSETAGVLLREDLAQVALVLIGHGAVVKHQVIRLVLFLTGQRPARPLMLIGGVVEDEIEHQADAVVA